MDWKNKWNVMMEAFEDRCDNWVYIMRYMENEEARQTNFFPAKMIRMKKNVLAAVEWNTFYMIQRFRD